MALRVSSVIHQTRLSCSLDTGVKPRYDNGRVVLHGVWSGNLGASGLKIGEVCIHDGNGCIGLWVGRGEGAKFPVVIPK